LRQNFEIIHKNLASGISIGVDPRHQRCHASLAYAAPAKAYFGRAQAIKRKTIKHRTLQHRKLAA
jgi:hypothetical protein